MRMTCETHDRGRGGLPGMPSVDRSDVVISPPESATRNCGRAAAMAWVSQRSLWEIAVAVGQPDRTRADGSGLGL